MNLTATTEQLFQDLKDRWCAEQARHHPLLEYLKTKSELVDLSDVDERDRNQRPARPFHKGPSKRYRPFRPFDHKANRVDFH